MKSDVPSKSNFAEAIERFKDIKKRHGALIESLKPHLGDWGIDEESIRNIETPRPELFAHLRPRAVLDRDPVLAEAAHAKLTRVLKNLATELTSLQNALSPSLGFTQLLALMNEPLKRVRSKLSETEDLPPEALFKILFSTPHLGVLSDFYRLHHYCRLDFQAFDRMDANSHLIEDLERELSGALFAIFGVEVITVGLFQHHFDPELHLVANIPTLTRFADARGEVRQRIHQLEPGVIYDLSEAGFHCPRFNFNLQPKVLYKSES